MFVEANLCKIKTCQAVLGLDKNFVPIIRVFNN